MDEHYVEVAVGAELSSAEPSDRQERYALQVPSCGGYEQLSELVVGRVAVRIAEFEALESGICQQRLALSAEGHVGPYHQKGGGSAARAQPTGAGL
jgi:hypothetical protein